MKSKKRIGRRVITLLVVMALAVQMIISSGVQGMAADTDTTTTVSFDVTYCQTEARTMLDMINAFRTGDDAWYWNSDNTTKTTLTDLSELSYDYALEEIAMQRAAEIALSFSHTRPDSTDCWSAYSEVTTATYYVQGENIDVEYMSTAATAFASWQETAENYTYQGHRRNMLSSSFTSIGIACVYYNGYYYWVQEFGYGNSSTSEIAANDSGTKVFVNVASSRISSLVSLSTNPTEYTIAVGDTATVPTVTAVIKLVDAWPGVYPDSVTASADWSVTDASLADISNDNLTAIASGTTTITSTVFGKLLSVPVTIKPSIAECTITCSPTSYIYDGSKKTPAVMVKYGETVLTEDTDYTLSYSDNVDAGTATVTVTGKGDYTGSKEVSFTISQANISSCDITLDPDSFTYDGSVKTPEITVKNGSATLAEGTDYAVSYEKNTSAGTGKVTITGCGNYTGTVEKTFTIKAASIANCSVVLDPESYTYDGTAKEPAVTVNDGTATLVSGTDYNVTYSDNTDAGTATVTVTGIGNYTGTVTQKFTINKKVLTAAISGTTTKTYDGTTDASKLNLSISLDGIVSGDTVSAAAESYAYNSAEVSTANTITAIGITLSGEDAKNYTLESTTASISANIAKADALVNIADTYNPSKTYDGQAVSAPAEDQLTLINVNYADLEFGWYEGEGTDGTLLEDAPTDAGTYTLKVVAAETGNYNSSSATTTFTISKASYTAQTYEKVVVSNQETSSITIDISDAIQKGGTAGTPTVSGEGAALIDSGSLAISDRVLTFNTTSQDDGTAAEITIPVTGCTNCEDYSITVNVTAKAVELSIDGSITGYTGVAIDDSEITLTIESGTAVFADSLTGADWITNLPEGLNQTVERVSDAVVKITVSGTTNTEMASCALQITIPAGNLTTVSGDLSVTGGSAEIEKSTYILKLTETSGTFSDLEYGYAEGNTVTYTFTNTGNQPITGLSATATGSFTAELESEINSINPGETVTVSVTSKTGMNAGTNTGTLTLTWVNAESDLTQSLSQTVKQAANYVTINKGSLSKSYDGSAAEIEATADYGTVEYIWYDENNNQLKEAPVTPGTYNVTAYVAETANYAGVSDAVEYVIAKASPEISLADKQVTYTGEAAEIGEAFVTLVNGETYDGEITYTYYSDADCTQKLDSLPVEIGTYYVVASIEETELYTTAESEAAALTILDKVFEDTDIVVEGYSGVYDGQSHTITVTLSGDAGDAEIIYCSEENGEYTQTAPSYTDVGTYTVYYKVVKDHYEEVTGSVAIKISKAAQYISYENTSVSKTEGDSDFTNPLTETVVIGNITYTSSNMKVAIVDADGKITIVAPGTVEITATAEGTDNYEEATASYTLTIAEKSISGKINDSDDSKKSDSSDSDKSDQSVSDSSSSNKSKENVSDTSESKAASTADSGNVRIWLMLIVIAGIGFEMAAYRRLRSDSTKKRR